MLGSQGTLKNKDNKFINDEKKNNKEIKVYDIDKLPNFFETESYRVYRPYDFEKAMKRLENLTEEDLKCQIFQEQQLDLETVKDDVSAELENVKILTMKKYRNKITSEICYQFIEIFDLNKISVNDGNKFAKIIVKLDSKNKDNIKTFLTIKNFIIADKIFEILEEDFATKSAFESTKEEIKALRANLKNIQQRKQEKSSDPKDQKNKSDEKSFELDFNFNCNIIQKMFSEESNKVILQLQSPPIYKTNFLIKRREETGLNKGENKNKTPLFEYTICPFKNFDKEISNLKLRNFLMYLEDKKPKEDINSSTLNYNQTETTLLDIFENHSLQFEVDDSPNLNIISESEYRKINNIELEIDEYFQDNKFIKIIKNYGFSDEQITALLYCTLVLVSNCILSYFNALDFIKNLENQDYFFNLFFPQNKQNKMDFYNTNLNSEEDIYYFIEDEEQIINTELFIECLVKIINIKLNSFCDLDLESFEDLFRQNYKVLFLKFYCDNETNNLKEKSPLSKFLIRSQRVIVTPTYTVFAPYTEDQGNRILREYLDNPMDGLRLVFKMDDFEDARFNNILLIEHIKIILSQGIKLYNKHFEFYNYSQSQFRTLGCWMVINPEKVLNKCGDFKNIKIVAKYGARIGQTLTSTLKTIEIPNEFNTYTRDISNETYYDSKTKKYLKPSKVYDFSDGVGTISFDLAERIAAALNLKQIPAAFQARYLGCKGVWTVIYDTVLDKIQKNNFDNIRDNLISHGIKFQNQILIRDTQKKFELNKVQFEEKKFFEVCNYSKFIKCYLNRQIILLMNSIGIDESVFIRKLKIYNESLAKEEFVLSLIQFEDWNAMFSQMIKSGINMSNDRLMRFVISSNKEILYRELKKRTRIFIEEGAYVIGIIDEFGILEYGEAFLRVKNEKVDLILNKKCAVTKCPCLHPGDIRLLNFKKYDPNKPQTKIYQIFEEYENVLIFPSKGKRPHPNEISGSDLDGDEYFVFYDSDLCRIKPVEPMDYSDNTKSIEKSNITRKDVIEFFANYSINSNLGLIADAHMAHSDRRGANDPICIQLAKKFALSVDAPKTGAKVTLDEENGENPEEFPHFMSEKAKKYTSRNVLGKLHDQILEYIDKMDKDRNNKIEFYDNDLYLDNCEIFYFEALFNYMDYMQRFVSLLKIYEIPAESFLLSGNNPDGYSSFDKKKHNYDLLEKLAIQLKENFSHFKNKFEEFEKTILEQTNFNFASLKNKKKKITSTSNENNNNKKLININGENLIKHENKIENSSEESFNNNYCSLDSKIKYFVKNNISLRASAYYFISYNFKNIYENIKNEFEYLDNCFDIYCDNLFEEMNDFVEENEYYEMNDQINYFENTFNDNFTHRMDFENKIQNKRKLEKQKILEKLNIMKNTVQQFIKNEVNPHNIPKEPTYENQYCILSFPWSSAGNYLADIKILSNV